MLRINCRKPDLNQEDHLEIISRIQVGDGCNEDWVSDCGGVRRGGLFPGDFEDKDNRK